VPGERPATLLRNNVPFTQFFSFVTQSVKRSGHRPGERCGPDASWLRKVPARLYHGRQDVLCIDLGQTHTGIANVNGTARVIESTACPVFQGEGMTADEAVEVGDLRGIHLFASLDDSQIRRVAEHMRVERLADGERLFDFGDPARRFYYLRSGMLKLYRLSPEGVEKVIWFVRPRETFAEAIMFMDKGDAYPVSAEAIAPSVVQSFDNATMLAILRESTSCCFRVMAAMSRRLRQQVEEIDRLTLHNATYRLANFLLQQIPLGVFESPELLLTMRKHDIASRLGIAPETLSRMLARLGQRGLIQVDRQNIVLRDIDGLRRLVDVERAKA